MFLIKAFGIGPDRLFHDDPLMKFSQ